MAFEAKARVAPILRRTSPVTQENCAFAFIPRSPEGNTPEYINIKKYLVVFLVITLLNTGHWYPVYILLIVYLRSSSPFDAISTLHLSTRKLLEAVKLLDDLTVQAALQAFRRDEPLHPKRLTQKLEIRVGMSKMRGGGKTRREVMRTT